MSQDKSLPDFVKEALYDKMLLEADRRFYPKRGKGNRSGHLFYEDLVTIMWARRLGQPVPEELQGLEVEPELARRMEEVWKKRQRKNRGKPQASGIGTGEDSPRGNGYLAPISGDRSPGKG